MKDVYGFKVIDCNTGDYILRWFGSLGGTAYLSTDTLEPLLKEQNNISDFKKAFYYTKKVCKKEGYLFITLSEDDFHKEESLIKHFFKKLFKRK